MINTGASGAIPRNDRQRMEKHAEMYYDLGGLEPERFEADYDIAVSWQRLIDGGNIHEMDFVLLNHELIEHSLMNEDCMPYAQAHREAEKRYNYIQYVKELDLMEGLK